MNNLYNVYDPQSVRLIVDQEVQYGMDSYNMLRMRKKEGKTEVSARMQMSSSTLTNILRKDSEGGIFEVVVLYSSQGEPLSSFHKNISEYTGVVISANLSTEVIFSEEFPVIELTFKEV